MGHIFVLEEGSNLVKAVFMIGISGSLRASTPFGGIASSHARATRERSGECEGLRRSLARSLAVNGELARGGYIAA